MSPAKPYLIDGDKFVSPRLLIVNFFRVFQNNQAVPPTYRTPALILILLFGTPFTLAFVTMACDLVLVEALLGFAVLLSHLLTPFGFVKGLRP